MKRKTRLTPQSTPAARTPDQAKTDELLGRLAPYIDQEIAGASQAIKSQNAQVNANLLTRLRAVETILTEKLGMTKDDLANKVAKIEDEAEGLESAAGPVQKGDRVRIEIRTRTKDQADWQGQSRFQVDSCGAGRSLGPELEGTIIGMTVGETREAPFGKDGGLVASITVNLISRAAKQDAPVTTETQDASPNAG